MTEQYSIYEAELSGPAGDSSCRSVSLSASFSCGSDTVRVNGFCSGEGKYRIRFMPPRPGIWTAVTRSSCSELDGIHLECTCTPAGPENHGPVRLRSQVVPRETETPEDRFHFAYEDGTRFQPFGTTCYAWIHQPEEVQEQTLETLSRSPFNKIRMCIFPKYYTFNETDPDLYPFTGSRETGFDFSSFSFEFWDRLEDRIARLDALGIQADIILFHPYDRWGFSRMSLQEDLFYLRYAVDRLSSFKNVWWSLANEFDLMPWKSVEHWETLAAALVERDPCRHLRSIHNCRTLYDHSAPWITHVSIQRVDVYKTAESITQWREQYQKPVIVDECAYEGNIDQGWGNITGEELVRRFWEGCIRGGYLSHGEVYIQYPQIWWSHGGLLHGTAPDRIAFLKSVMEDVPVSAVPLDQEREDGMAAWDLPGLGCSDCSFFLFYFGFSRPAFRTWTLPENCTFEIELIDTWNMTVEKLPGTFSGSIRIDMPERQYMAVRMRRV